MNATIGWIFTILGAAFVLLTVYGAAKLNRKNFLLGLFCFSFIPLIGEGSAYCADKAPIHVMVFFMFLTQLVLALPNKIAYGQDNEAATKLSAKIALAFLLINVAGAIFVLCLNSGVAVQFGYYHVVFALAVLYLMLKRMSGSGASWMQ